MGRHRTKIDPAAPPVDEQPSKKRKRSSLEAIQEPNGHPNGVQRRGAADEAEQRDRKKLKEETKEKRIRSAAAVAEPVGAVPLVADEDAVDVQGASEEIREHKEPRKAKKRKQVEAERDEPPLSAKELKRRMKYDAIFAKYEKAAEAAASEKANAPPQADVEADKNTAASKSAELHDLTPFPQPQTESTSHHTPTFSALPPWLAKPIIVHSSTTAPFADLKLSTKLQENLERRGLKEMLAVQSAVIPLLLRGATEHRGDVCVSAPTGSGKTLAYIPPMVESFKQKITTRLRGLIVVPTRELVVQAREVAEWCVAGTGLQIGTAVGNVSLSVEQDRLLHRGQRYDPAGFKKIYDEACKRLDTDFYEDEELQNDLLELLPDHVPEFTSKVDILICTPGRLVEHIRTTRGFSLRDADWLVIDEADRLLDESFQEWVTTLLEALHPKNSEEQLSATERVLRRLKPPPEERHVRKIVLSATMTRDLSKLASLRLWRPTLVTVVDQVENTHTDIPATDHEETSKVEGENFELPNSLSEKAVPVGDGSNKPLYLLRLLQGHVLKRDPQNVSRFIPAGISLQGERTLVFVHNNENASRLAFILKELLGSDACRVGLLAKTSSTSKTARKTLQAFRRGELQILIATDRASRGLDVPGIAHVINYDVPANTTSYVHRVGRTARAMSEGMAWTLFSDSEARWFWKEIAKARQIRRSGKTVERMMVDIEGIDGEMRVAYEKALQGLQSAVVGDE